MTPVVFLYATAPDEATALRIGRAAVEAGLAACLNILGPTTSLYRWNGAIETAREVAFLLKTTADHADALRDLVLRLHPYEVPALAALEIGSRGSNPAFLDWIRAECGGPESSNL